MDQLDAQLNGLLVLVIAAFLSAVPGWERERRQRPAGLRTHMLVGMSSAMLTIMARSTLNDDSAARLVANIVQGIGFLGAGVILQRKGYVYDVTTAASIWMVALLGIVIGYEWYVLATGATLLMWIILAYLRNFETKTNLRPHQIPDGKDKTPSN